MSWNYLKVHNVKLPYRPAELSTTTGHKFLVFKIYETLFLGPVGTQEWRYPLTVEGSSRVQQADATDDGGRKHFKRFAKHVKHLSLK